MIHQKGLSNQLPPIHGLKVPGASGFGGDHVNGPNTITSSPAAPTSARAAW